MAYNLPNTMAPDVSLGKGLDRGTSLYHTLMQHAVARAQNRRAEEMQPYTIKHLLAQIQNANSANQRAEGLYPEQLKALHNKNDPDYEMNNMIRQYQRGNKIFGGQNDAIDNQPIRQPSGEMDESTINELMHRPLDRQGLKQKLEEMGMFGQQGNAMPQGQGALMPEQPQDEPESLSLNEEQMQELESQANNEVAPQDMPRKTKQKPYTPFQISFGKAMEKKGFVNPFPQIKEHVLHGPARDAADLERLKKESGENSDVYKNAKAAYDAQLDAKKDLRDLRARTKTGLRPGEKEFFDETTGSPLGKEIPLTAVERQSEEGNILFNELYPYVYKGASPFSGDGSITRLQNAAANYKNDPKARKLMDDFLLADKMLAATTVNEASTLKAGKTNTTYRMLKDSLESQDIPRIIKKLVKEYNLPPSAQLKAGMRYQKLLSDARQKARKGTPATQKLFYDPEQQARHELEQDSGGDVKSVIVIDPNGKSFETTESNAAHLPKGWTRG